MGRLYLKLYKEHFVWDELKDVLKNWNIDGGSAFRSMDAKDIEAVRLGQHRTIWQEHSARDFAVEKGIFPQEYFVYFKGKYRLSNAKDQPKAADAIVRCCLR